ncbi:hypothetical protein DET60_102241 [Raoultella planticola]|nr:hypothetical protein DET60_102241 [Raoultella planticola]
MSRMQELTGEQVLWWQTIVRKYYPRAAGKTINQFKAETTLGLT